MKGELWQRSFGVSISKEVEEQVSEEDAQPLQTWDKESPFQLTPSLGVFYVHVRVVLLSQDLL